MTSSKDTGPVLATVAKMRAAEPGTIMLDSFGNEYSATAGDYFWMFDHDFFMDDAGEPMVLVTRHTMYRDAQVVA
jgi:hypothetical protein